MYGMTNRVHIAAVVGLLIVLALLGYFMNNLIPNRTDLPYDTGSTILAAEFATMPDEIVAVLGTAHNYAAPLKEAQYIDFAFIACYVAAFVLMGWALRNYDIPGPRGAAWTAVICAVLAGVFDVLENMAVLRTIANPATLHSNVRWFSLPKWGLVFFTMFVESLLFLFWPRLKLWWRLAAVVVGLLFLFVGASGVLFTLLTSVDGISWSADWMTAALIGTLVFMAAMLVRLRYSR